MTVRLNVVLDQLVAPTEPDLAMATRQLAAGLVAVAPAGCEVVGLMPAGAADSLPSGVEPRALRLPRRELAAAWQVGMPTGAAGGMIHSPTLMAPLVKHDRVHDHDQTVVSLWDLRSWDAPDELPRARVLFERAMLKRAVKHADAVVVPTHALAGRLGEIARLGDRVRVIAGAAPSAFRAPNDAVARLRDLNLPHTFVALSGGVGTSHGLAGGLRAVAAAGRDAVVLDVPEGEEPAVAEIASAAGLPERRMHARAALDDHDRAAVLASATAFVAPAESSSWPWRAVEALALGVPVVAAESQVHQEVIADGGLVVHGADLGEALAQLTASDAALQRARVLALDRARAFAWDAAAERVWHLHAEL
ncbi:glycosyltransferase [Microbacterium sp. DT81.1]|uniref:glycosyltransferase n=1 Tax=Microbacterium sp. DT81.1 TaxID=3393413 RepID=UPI003CEE2869